LIKLLQQKSDIVIDEGTTDKVTTAGYDLRQAELRTTSFREFIETHKNELLALEILYSKPYPKRRLTYQSIHELAQRLTDPPYHLTTADVWQAYRRLESSLVRGVPADKVLTEIISLVRFATGQDDILEPYAGRVTQRFNLWIGRQKKAGRVFTDDQLQWLEAIRDYLAVNVEIAPADLMRDNPFSAWGGVVAAKQVFGQELNGLLDELSEALAA
jgi:type I restriction enzyme R subunit